MIPGLSYWSLAGGLENTLPMGDALMMTRDAGFGALELAVAGDGVLTPDSTQSQCEDVRAQIDGSGLHVSTVASGMSWGANPVSNYEAVREASNAAIEKTLQRVAWLGCDAFLYVPGIVGCPFVPDQKVRYDLALQRCGDNLRRLLPVAETVGVDLCLENVWNGMFLSPLEFRDFIDSFGSDRLGSYLDVGNLLGYHQHPPHWIQLLQHRIKRVHVKDFKHDFDWQGRYDFCRLGEGDVPWPETVDALRAIGYDRTVIAEMLPPDPAVVQHTARALPELLNRQA